MSRLLRSTRKPSTANASTRPLRAEELEDRRMLTIDFTLLKDVEPSIFSAGHDPADLVELNGVAYYSAYDPAGGRELWRSDGTAEGTYRLKDIYSGTGDSSPSHLTNIDGTLYFTAYTPDYGEELWKSDGTAEGTVMVADAMPGVAGLFGLGQLPVTPYFVRAGSSIFFQVVTDSTKTDLWKTDGTAEGTMLVERIHDGVGSHVFQTAAALGDVLIFRAPTGKLWTSDGTPEGTALLEPTGAELSEIYEVTPFDGEVYFSADDRVHGHELWKTDGTSAGTVLVSDLSSADFGSFPWELTVFDGALYFTAHRDFGADLLKLQAGGSVPELVRDVPANVPIENLAVAGDGLYYAYENKAWRTTGALGGDILLSEHSAQPAGFTAVGSQVYYRIAEDSAHELWVTDGAGGAANFVYSSRTPNYTIEPSIVAAGGAALFSGGQSTIGQELWRTEGAPATTAVVRDLVIGRGSDPGDFVKIGDAVYFSTNTGLWKTDGTVAGTVLVKELVMASQVDFAGPGWSVAMNGQLYFVARGPGDFGYQLWKSDGTTEGTVRVKTINPFGSAFLFPTISNSGDPGPYLTALDGLLYFRATDGVNGLELWRSDGTADGTLMLTDSTYFTLKSSFANSSRPFSPEFAAHDGQLFFRAADSSGAVGLWKTDGTVAGTTRLNLAPNNRSYDPESITSFGGELYFFASIGAEGYGLWKTDAAGTSATLVKSSQEIRFTDVPLELHAAGQYLYFTRKTSLFSVSELWRTDGTAEGLVRLSDNMQFTTRELRNLTAVGETLFFVRDMGFEELWKTDGTLAGTVLLDASFQMLPLISVGGSLYYSADYPPSGFTLHTSDGTVAGTAPVIAEGHELARQPIHFIAEVNGRLIVAATTERYGMELWSGPAPGPAEVAGDFDRDGDADGRDFLRWQRTLGASVTPEGAGADADLDGHITGDDLGAWRTGFGDAAAGSSAAAAFAATAPAIEAALASYDTRDAAWFVTAEMFSAPPEQKPLTFADGGKRLADPFALYAAAPRIDALGRGDHHQPTLAWPSPAVERDADSTALDDGEQRLHHLDRAFAAVLESGLDED